MSGHSRLTPLSMRGADAERRGNITHFFESTEKKLNEFQSNKKIEENKKEIQRASI
jgi:hypothetical protein